MPKVVVGLSGGVDSAVAALLLKKEGYEVIGVTLRTWIGENGEDSRCCEIDDARRVSWKLDIPYHVFNCVEEFRQKVTDPFISEYLVGRTPNPCVGCNRDIKWARMLQNAEMLGAEYVATGHYANIVRLENGRYTVKKAAHLHKDQTYMLYKLSQNELSRTLMPLGNMEKSEVRKIAEEAGLPIAAKADSQDICFIADGDYAGYICRNSKDNIPPEGNFVDEDGNILGKHKGIIHYTVGQRKGLGLAMGHPVFVKRIDAVKNEVVISDDENLFTKKVILSDFNFLSIEDLEIGDCIRCFAKIRYRHEPQAALLTRLDDKRLCLDFDEAVRAATPGQSSVFYDENDNLVGGGVID